METSWKPHGNLIKYSKNSQKPSQTAVQSLKPSITVYNWSWTLKPGGILHP